jgi:hypothetical protein
MSRYSTRLNVVLSIAVIALAWMAFRRDDAPTVPDAVFAGSGERSDTVAPSGSSDRNDVDLAVLDRLQRIDARLSTLEQGGQAAATGIDPPKERIDPRMAAEADRRIAVVFSDREVNQDDWFRWQSALSEMPRAERMALGAAFARAVNRDQLKLQF